MSVIDQRIVEMIFDNSNFEKNVKESNDTLEKFNKKLNDSTTTDGLANALSLFSSSIGSFTDKLSTKGIAAITVVQNLVNRVVDSGIDLVKSLSIDNILGGYQKYESELVSVQKIMNATGKDIEEVYEQLGRLAWYTDETSYNYESMAAAIGAFTSQGYDLEQATSAVQGIANLAGLAAAPVQSTMHAMEGLSRIMGSGYMSVQGWQWLRTAGLETEATKEQFIEAAAAAGTLRKASDGTYRTKKKGTKVDESTFVSTLNEKWLTSDAMMKTFVDMAKFSDLVYQFQNNYQDLTGSVIDCSRAMEILTDKEDLSEDKVEAYIKSYEKAYGVTLDQETALKNLSEWVETVSEKAFRSGQVYRTFSDAIGATKEAVSSAWKSIFKDIFGDAEESKKVWTELGTRLYNTFVPPLLEIESVVSEWANDEDNGRKKLLDSLFALAENIHSIFSVIAKAFRSVFPKKTADDLKDLTKRFSEWVEKVKPSEELLSKVEKAATGFFNALKLIGGYTKAVIKGLEPFKQVLRDVYDFVERNILAFFGWITETRKAKEASDSFAKVTEKVRNASQKIVSVIYKILDGIKVVYQFINEKIFGGSFIGKIKELFAYIHRKFIEFKGSKFYETLVSIWEKVKGLFDAIKTKLTGAFTYIKDRTTITGRALYNTFASSGSLLTSLVNAIGYVLTNLLGVVNELITNFAGSGGNTLAGASSIFFANFALQIGRFFKRLSDYVFWQMEADIAESFYNIAKGLLIIAFAMLILASIDGNKLLTALGVINVILTLIAKLITSLNLFADIEIAFGDLKGAFKNVLAAVTQGIKIIALGQLLKSLGLAMIEFAAAMFILSLIPSDQLWTITGAMGALMLALGLFLRMVINNSSKVMANAFQIKALGKVLKSIGLAMTEMASAAVMFSKANLQGLIAVGVALVLTVLAVKWLLKSLETPTIKDAAKPAKMASIWMLGKLFKALGLAMIELAIAAKIMSGIDEDTLTSFGVILGVFLIGVIAATNMVPGITKMLGLSILCSVMGLAMIELAAALKIIETTVSNGNAEEAVKTMLVIMLAFLVAVTGAAAAAPNALKLLGFAAAVIILAQAFVILAGVSAALAAIGIAGVGVALAFILGLFGILFLATKFFTPILGMFLALSGALMLFGVALIVQSVGIVLFAKGLIMLGAGIISISGALDILITAIINIIIAVIVAIPVLLAKFTEAIILGSADITKAMVALLFAVLEAIRILIPEFVLAILEALAQTLKAIADNVGVITEALFDIVINVVEGIANKIVPLMASIGKLIHNTFVALLVAINWNELAVAIGGLFVLGVFFVELAAVVLLGIAATLLLPILADNLSNFTESAKPFFDSLKRIGKDTIDSAKALAEMIFIFTASSLLNAITSFLFGAPDYTQFGKALVDFAPYLKRFSDQVKNVDNKAVKGSAIAAEMLLNFYNKLPRSGGLFSDLFGQANIEKFAVDIVTFAQALHDYAVKLGTNFNGDLIKASANAAESLAALANKLPRKGGWLQDLIGTTEDIDVWGKRLPKFAAAMRTYGEKLGGDFNGDNITASANAAEALATLNDKLPKKEGWLQNVIGTTEDIDVWGKRLPSLAEALTGFNDNLGTDFDKERTTGAADLLLKFSDLQDKIGKTDGLLQWFAGFVNIPKFAEGLKILGTGLGAFYRCLNEADLRKGNMGIGNLAAITLGNLATAISKVDSYFSIDYVNAFASVLPAVGKGVRGFLLELKGTAGLDGRASAAYKTIESFPILVEALNDLDSDFNVEIAKGFAQFLPELGRGLASLFGFMPTSDFNLKRAIATTDMIRAIGENWYGINQLASIELGEDPNQIESWLGCLGRGLGEFCRGFRGWYYAGIIDEALPLIESLAENVDGIDDLFDLKLKDDVAFEKMMLSFGIGIHRFALQLSGLNIERVEAVMKVVDGLPGTIKDCLSAKSQSFTNVLIGMNDFSSKCVDTFCDTFRNSAKDITKAIGDFYDDLKETIGNKVEEFKRLFFVLGQQCVDGYVLGLKSRKIELNKATKEIGDDTIEDLAISMEVESPSKATYRIGSYVAEGFINALYDSAKDAGDSARYFGESSMAALQNTIQSMSDSIQDEFNNDFVIRPTLDLTSLRQSASEIDSLLGADEYLEANADGIDSTRNGVTFIQNNYSPKALSRYEIYSDTKNFVSSYAGGLLSD